MSGAWIAEETAMAKFEDKRLNDRFAAIFTAFGDRPNVSIPEALNGRSELEACYRFFDNDNVPQKPLKLGDMVRWVTSLGGYVLHPNRKTR